MKKKRGIKIKVHVIILLILLIILVLVLASLILQKTIKKPGNLLNVSNSTFTIVVLPDTQTYTQNYPDILINQTTWVSINKNPLNIRMVIFVGDLVNSNNKEQWNRLNDSLSVLDESNIPYSVIPGNHDLGLTNNDLYYNEYLPVSRFNNKSWFGGNFNNYKNNYQLQTINNQDFIFISLDLCPNKQEIDWANNILDKYPNYTGVLTTHAYLNTNEPPQRYVNYCSSTEYIWNDLIKLHQNLQLVLCGHMHTEKRRVDDNNFNKPVYQILADYQDVDNGKSGYLRILTYDTKNKIINIETYSPYLNLYKTDYESEFSIKL